MKSGREIVIGFVYLPVCLSPFYDRRSLIGIKMLEDAILQLKITSKTDLLFIGDLNARTADRTDCLHATRSSIELEAYCDLLFLKMKVLYIRFHVI